jgi:hypothetical protein
LGDWEVGSNGGEMEVGEGEGKMSYSGLRFRATGGGASRHFFSLFPPIPWAGRV